MATTTSTTLVRLAAFAKAMLAVAKFAAASASGSAAMLAEGVNSIAGAISLALLAWGLAVSGPVVHPASRREAIFWGYVVGTMVMSLAAGVAIVLGVQRMQVPEAINLDSLPFFVLAAAALFEFGFLFAVRAEHLGHPSAAANTAGGDPALRTLWLQGLCAPAGLIAAAAGLVATSHLGIDDGDGIAAIVVGLVIGAIAALLAFEVRAVLRHAMLAPPATTGPASRSTSEARAPAINSTAGATPTAHGTIIAASTGPGLTASVTSLPMTGAVAPPSVILVETPASAVATLTEATKGAAEVAPLRQPAAMPAPSNSPPPKRGKGKKRR